MKTDETEDEALNSFFQARLLARKGCYREATLALDEAEAAGDCTPAQALDLRARINAQQGQLLEAAACWQQALELEPNNLDYSRGLTALRSAGGGRTSHRLLLLRSVVTLANFMLLVALFQGLRSLERGQATLDERLRSQAHATPGPELVRLNQAAKRLELSTSQLATLQDSLLELRQNQRLLVEQMNRLQNTWQKNRELEEERQTARDAALVVQLQSLMPVPPAGVQKSILGAP